MDAVTCLVWQNLEILYSLAEMFELERQLNISIQYKCIIFVNLLFSTMLAIIEKEL